MESTSAFEPTVFDALPAWSRSIDPAETPGLEGMAATAQAFLALSAASRRVEVERFHRQYCFPRMALPRASALYLFLRVIFELPEHLDRRQAKVFGGWMHPSVGPGLPDFDMLWPVRIDASTGHLSVERFQGYFGKGYDALGEYDYMREHFPLRSPASIDRVLP